MTRRSAARLIAVSVFVVLVALDVALFPTVLPHLRSLASPHGAATPKGTARPAPTPPPVSRAPAEGTYWTCEANQSDNGTVTPNATPPAGSVSSPLCDSSYGESEPGQPQPPLTSGIEIWRVPVGNFKPFVHCGAKVVNIVDPYDSQAVPRTWPAAHRLLFDAGWNQVPSGRC